MSAELHVSGLIEDIENDCRLTVSEELDNDNRHVCKLLSAETPHVSVSVDCCLLFVTTVHSCLHDVSAQSTGFWAHEAVTNDHVKSLYNDIRLKITWIVKF